MATRLLLVAIEAESETCGECVHVTDDPESVTGGRWCELFKERIPRDVLALLRLEECKGAERAPE